MNVQHKEEEITVQREQQHVQILKEVSHVIVILDILEMVFLVMVMIIGFFIFNRGKNLKKSLNQKSTDINECLTNNGGCSSNAKCTNTAGSRTCACKAGYSGDGVTCNGILCFFFFFFCSCLISNVMKRFKKKK